MKGVVLFQILDKLSCWTGRKAWAGPDNTALYVHRFADRQAQGRNIIYFAAVSTSCPFSSGTNN
jgi:hypothetical protein